MATFRDGVQGALRAPRAIEQFRIGESAEITKYFGTAEVAAFAALIGDENPIHLDPEFARATRFGACIVHGTFYTGLIGTVLATACPGPGTILVAQEHRFLRPVFVGDTVTASVTITEIDPVKGSIHLSCECRNQDGEKVLSGWAITSIAR